MVKTDNPKKKTLKDKFSDFVYSREARKIGRKHSDGTVLDSRKTSFFIIALLIIPVANWVVFWLIVNVQSICLAFQEPRTGAWTLNNFKSFWDTLTLDGGELGIALKNTLIYFGASIIIVLPISYVIAYFLYKKIVGYKIFRVIFYLPAIIAGTALVTAYKALIGVGNVWDTFLHLFGKEVPIDEYLAHPETATTVILIYTIFTSFTGNVLLFSGAMARVPTEVLESAKLEGCSPFRELIELIFPLIWPTFATQLVFAMTGIFTSSGPILLFNPSNDSETMTISYWIFKKVYATADFSPTIVSYTEVSTAGLCFTLAGMPIILGVRKLTDKIEPVEY